MAVTGKTHVIVEPGPRKTGAKVQRLPEGSSQTYPRGALLIRSAGYISAHTTSNVSVSLYGIAAKSGGNKTAVGLNNAAVFRFEPDQPFKIAISGALAESQLGATLALSQDTAGKVFGITAAAASDSSVGRIVQFAEGFAGGDTNPVVLFVPLVAKIQES
jgi:hypothetical protein